MWSYWRAYIKVLWELRGGRAYLFSDTVVYKSWSGKKWISRLGIIKKYKSWGESDIEDNKGSYLNSWP